MVILYKFIKVINDSRWLLIREYTINLYVIGYNLSKYIFKYKENLGLTYIRNI